MNAYRVKVNTTNALGKTTYGPGKGETGKEPYRDCEHGEVYVVTADPKIIYDEFPLAVLVEKIGCGYYLGHHFESEKELYFESNNGIGRGALCN